MSWKNSWHHLKWIVNSKSTNPCILQPRNPPKSKGQDYIRHSKQCCLPQVYQAVRKVKNYFDAFSHHYWELFSIRCRKVPSTARLLNFPLIPLNCTKLFSVPSKGKQHLGWPTVFAKPKLTFPFRRRKKKKKVYPQVGITADEPQTRRMYSFSFPSGEGISDTGDVFGLIGFLWSPKPGVEILVKRGSAVRELIPRGKLAGNSKWSFFLHYESEKEKKNIWLKFVCNNFKRLMFGIILKFYKNFNNWKKIKSCWDIISWKLRLCGKTLKKHNFPNLFIFVKFSKSNKNVDRICWG